MKRIGRKNSGGFIIRQDDLLVLMLICAVAGALLIVVNMAWREFSEWRIRKAAERSFEDLRQHTLTNGVTFFANELHGTNYESAVRAMGSSEWFDYASSEIARRQADEITEAQAFEKLLGYQPRTNPHMIKAWIHMREAAELAGIGKAIDEQTGIMNEAMRTMFERPEFKPGPEAEKAFFERFEDINVKGTM